MATCGEVLVKILQNLAIITFFGTLAVIPLDLFPGLKEVRLITVRPGHERGAGLFL